MRIGHTFHLDSAHTVPSVPKCARLHGHTYKVEVEVHGEPGADGMIIEFGQFKRDAWDQVLGRYDHVFLNEVMAEVPTVENLVKRLQSELAAHYPAFRIHVRVWEGHGKYAEAP